MTPQAGMVSGANKPASRTLVVGIGSPHGDDQAGWLVAEAMQKLQMSGVDIRQASTPSHLLDWLDGVDRLIVCDACLRGSEMSDVQAAGTTDRMQARDQSSVYRWQWPNLQAATLRSAGSHAFGLPQVLHLAERLGRLPQQVFVYGIEASEFCAFANVTSDVASAINTAVVVICEELGIACVTEAAHHA